MAMKRHWQFGIIAMAFTGVSTYNFLFFKDYSASGPANAPMETAALIAESEPVSQALTDSFGRQIAGSRPPISLETLQQKAQFAFTPSPEKEAELEMENRLQTRNEFSTYQAPPQIRSKPAKSSPVIKEKPTPEVKLPEPQYALSGTLIDHDRRLALIDGIPLSVGSRMGAWQLARIESDFIILQSGTKTHRIELMNVGLQVAQKEP